MNSGWKSDIRAAVPSWIEARLYVAAAFIVTNAVVDRLEPAPAFSPVSDGLLAWDGTWYRLIADQGYTSAHDQAARFFPLWPLIGRFGGWLTGSTELALVVMANLLALVAGALLHRLVMAETGDRDTARLAVRLFAIAPPAFVLVLAYSESLFLALALAMVLALRSKRWWAAAILGYLAGLTRPVASLLAISAAVAVWQSGGRREIKKLIAVAAAPLGTLTFLAWSAIALDDWSAPIDSQRKLRGDAHEPISRLAQAWWRGVGGDSGELFHFLAAIAIVALAVVVFRRLSPILWAYAVPSTLILIAADNLNSMERYALSVFPLIIAAAIISKRPILRNWLPTASAVAMASLTMLALNGVYVP